MPDKLLRYIKDKTLVSDGEIELLRPLLKVLVIQKGTHLLRPNDVCTDLIFVSSGCLRSYIIDNKGKEYVLQFAPENWWVSDLNSYLKEEPAIYNIEAIENSRVVLLSRELFFNMDRIIPKVAQMFQNLLQNNNLAVQKRLILSLSASAEERYVAFVKSHPHLALRVPQHMIASYLGIAPESLSRVRKKVSTRLGI